MSLSDFWTDSLALWHISSSPTKKTGVYPHQSVQMASQKLRKTSTVSPNNMNQYILTRIKCVSDEPLGPPKTIFLLLSNLFIFVCPHERITYPMTHDFWTGFQQSDLIFNTWTHPIFTLKDTSYVAVREVDTLQHVSAAFTRANCFHSSFLLSKPGLGTSWHHAPC